MKVIHNKRPQRVVIALLDDNGNPISRRLNAHQRTEPIPEDKIGAYTCKLAQTGRLKIREAV